MHWSYFPPNTCRTENSHTCWQQVFFRAINALHLYFSLQELYPSRSPVPSSSLMYDEQLYKRRDQGTLSWARTRHGISSSVARRTQIWMLWCHDVMMTWVLSQWEMMERWWMKRQWRAAVLLCCRRLVLPPPIQVVDYSTLRALILWNYILKDLCRSLIT